MPALYAALGVDIRLRHGYYGDLGDVVVTEDARRTTNLPHKLRARWEQIARRAQSDQTHVCPLRTGVVPRRKAGSPGNGSLFRLGLGGPVVRSLWPFGLDSHRRYGQRHPVVAG